MNATTLYRFFDTHGALLYVGISEYPLVRMHQHRLSKTWWLEIASSRFEHFESREAALMAEAAAIRSERPRYNVVGRARPSPLPEPKAVGVHASVWTRLCRLEPRLRGLEFICRGPVPGMHCPPRSRDVEPWNAALQRRWYGWDTGGDGVRRGLRALVGWGRGEGWAWRSEDDVPGELRVVTLAEVPEPAGMAAQRERDAQTGRSCLWTSSAYEAGYAYLYRRALPWAHARRWALAADISKTSLSLAEADR